MDVPSMSHISRIPVMHYIRLHYHVAEPHAFLLSYIPGRVKCQFCEMLTKALYSWSPGAATGVRQRMCDDCKLEITKSADYILMRSGKVSISQMMIIAHRVNVLQQGKHIWSDNQPFDPIKHRCCWCVNVNNRTRGYVLHPECAEDVRKHLVSLGWYASRFIFIGILPLPSDLRNVIAQLSTEHTRWKIASLSTGDVLDPQGVWFPH